MGRRLIGCLLVLPLLACGEEQDSAEAQGPRAVVEAIIDQQIIPSHDDFADAARAQQAAVVNLCASPNDGALQASRAAFGKAAISWSRIEWVSFGPAREANRREALFFWPDSRGRGLAQAKALAASDTAAQFAPEGFADKSVAVKGLLALEFVLFGEGADSLMTPNAPRCAYAAAITTSIADTAEALAEAWSGPEGHRALMRDAGPQNPVYKNHREALQRLLTAASEQMQIVRDLKASPLLRERQGVPTPISPPFAEAGFAVDALRANVESAAAVFLDHAAELLPTQSAYRAESLAFEVEAIERILAELESGSLTTDNVTVSEEVREQIDYLLNPLNGAHGLMADVFAGELGLISGFNSLDGD